MKYILRHTTTFDIYTYIVKDQTCPDCKRPNENFTNDKCQWKALSIELMVKSSHFKSNLRRHSLQSNTVMKNFKVKK